MGLTKCNLKLIYAVICMQGRLDDLILLDLIDYISF